MLFRYLEQSFADAGTLAIPGGQRRITESNRGVGHDAPVVGILRALEPRLPVVVREREFGTAQDRAQDTEEGRAQVIVQEALGRKRAFRLQPPVPPVAARVLSETAPRPLVIPMFTPLDALEVAAHLFGAPGGIAGQIGDLIPVGILRVHEDHRAVRGAAAERGGPRVQHAVHLRAVDHVTVVRIARLRLLVAVMANEEIPSQTVVFGGHRMERGHVVVVGQAVDARCVRRRPD